MKNVIFWGGTGQSKVLNEAISYGDFKLVCIVDNREIKNLINDDVIFLRGFEGLTGWLNKQVSINQIYCAVAIGGDRGRERLSLLKKMKSIGLSPLTIVHPTAFVAQNAIIGEGCQILAHSTVCVNVKIGAGSIINSAASIDHDCNLGKGVHIAPGAHLAGEISIGDGSFIGTGATILPGIKIGKDVIVGAGAVVLKDIRNGNKVVGNPARQI